MIRKRIRFKPKGTFFRLHRSMDACMFWTMVTALTNKLGDASNRLVKENMSSNLSDESLFQA